MEIKTNTAVFQSNRDCVAKELVNILADEYLLFAKTKNAQRCIKEMNFEDTYKFFEAQFNELDRIVNSLGDHVRTFGHYSDALLKAFLSVNHFDGDKIPRSERVSFFRELLNHHESLIAILRNTAPLLADEFHDPDTSRFISGIMESHQRIVWFLRFHMK